MYYTKDQTIQTFKEIYAHDLKELFQKFEESMEKHA